jgi:hypothetical protein
MKLKTFRSAAEPGAVAAAVRSAVSQVEEPRALVLFSSGHADKPDLLRATLQAASESAKLPVVGVTTGGAHFTEAGPATTGVAGGVLGGADVTVQVALSQGLGADPAVVERAVRELKPGKGLGHTVLVFADGLACDGAKMADAIRQSIPTGWRAVGGMAGDDWKLKKTYVFRDGQVLGDAAVFLYVNTPERTRVACRHGYSVAQGAAELKITDLTPQGVKTINGKPAFVAYREELERLGLFRAGGEPLQVMARYPLALVTPFGEKLMIRTPLSKTDDGGVGLNAGVKEGDVLRVIQGDMTSITNGARQLSQEVVGGHAEAVMAFDCAGRRELFSSQYGDLVKALGGSLGSAPMLGFATYGEIAIYGGQLYNFHNYTTAMVAW